MIADTNKDIAVAYDGDELVGYGVCEDPGILWLQADVTRSDAAEAIVEWFMSVVDDRELIYPAPPGAYAKAGFEPIDRGRTYILRR